MFRCRWPLWLFLQLLGRRRVSLLFVREHIDKSGVWGFHGGTIRLVGSCSCGRDSLQLFRSSAGPSQFLRISAVFKKAVYVSSFFGYLLLNFC